MRNLKEVDMKITILVLCFSMLVAPSFAYDKPSGYPKEKYIYEVDVQRASDLEQAWAGLRRYIDRDHYVGVFFQSGDHRYKNFKLMELNRYGALVNVKLENLDDDDDWTVLSIRASTILKLQIIEED